MQLSDDMSSKEDIARIREIRALEPLSQAWEVWKKDRVVRFILLFQMSLLDVHDDQ
jgi:hypothetical protein